MNRILNNNLSSLNGAWELDPLFASSAGLESGFLSLKLKDSNILYNNYDGIIVYDSSDGVALSELFNIKLYKFKLWPELITASNEFSFTTNINYLNKKSVILPEKEIKFILDNNNLSLSLLSTDESKELYGLFNRNATIKIESSDDSINIQ